jgi:hypothetical protein
MSIVRFGFNPSDIPADIPTQHVRPTQHRGAGYHTWSNEARTHVEAAGPTALYTWETHVGLCLRDYERNGYDDSDFHMVVWNPEKGEPEDICFASTRGWSYPSYNSYVDATPEVREAYAAWQRAQERRNRASALRHQRASDSLLAADLGLSTRKAATRLRESLGGRPLTFQKGRLLYVYSRVWDRPEQRTFLAVCKLLKTEKFKSEFRASLAQQVKARCRDPAPRHSTPLSPKQLGYI